MKFSIKNDQIVQDFKLTLSSNVAEVVGQHFVMVFVIKTLNLPG